MKIRTKLSLLFALISASILILFSLSIYYSSETFRKEQFYNRLEDHALTTTRLLISVKEIDVELLKIIGENTILLPHEEISIYNSLNEKIYSSIEKDSIVISIDLLNQVRLRSKIQFKSEITESLGILYTDNNNQFVVIASAYDKYGLGKLNNLKLILLINFLISILIILFVGWFYAGQALQPMSKVIKRVDEIKETSLNLRVETENKKDEIAQLAQTFNKMLDRLEEAFNIQKIFVSNASHELRTPLTSITGQIEVTLLNKRDSEYYETVLLSILDDIKNINILSDGLLNLAQATLEINESHFSKVRIDEIIWTVRAELLKHKPDYNIEFAFGEMPSEEEKYIVLGNETLIKIAILNILENGCKYSDNKTVRLSLDVSDKKISIKFSDSGIGIAETELNKIFEPFYRAKNARKYKGHGLGLALSKKIIELHNGKIEVKSKIDIGTDILIILQNIF